jgi:hypothetical protein
MVAFGAIFLNVEEGTANRLAGLGSFISGLVALALAVRDRAAPAGPKSRPPPPEPEVLLRFLSFTAVETTAITAAFDRYGADWPKVAIEWPEASRVVAERIRAGMRAIERAGAGERPDDSGTWLALASDALNDMERWRAEVERGFPAYARRVAGLGSCVAAVERYLQRAHWQIFHHAASSLRWSGLRRFGIEPPVEWDRHYEINRTGDEALANLLEPGQALRGVAVTSVDGQKIPGEAYVQVPERVADDLRRRSLWPRDFARFLAPGLELHWSARPHLPASYAEEPLVAWRKIT